MPNDPTPQTPPTAPVAPPPAPATPPQSTPTSPNAAAPPATPEATPPAGAPPKTLADGDPADAPPAPTDFPADWRTRMAGGDEKAQKILERFASPKAVADALVDVRTKISKGELKAPTKAPGDDATPEQIAEWRQANDIPEAPEKYDAALPDGMVLGEADKPMLESFQKAMHAANIPQAHFKAALGWWQAQQIANQEKLTLADAGYRKGAEDTLREQWGPEYRVNVTLYKEALESLPDGLGDLLNTARDAEGRLLGANPAFVSHMVNLRRESNPVATVMAGTGVSGAQAMESEMAGIRKQMSDPNSPYNKGPKIRKVDPSTGYEREETALAWRYAELLAAEERMGKKAA